MPSKLPTSLQNINLNAQEEQSKAYIISPMETAISIPVVEDSGEIISGIEKPSVMDPAANIINNMEFGLQKAKKLKRVISIMSMSPVSSILLICFSFRFSLYKYIRLGLGRGRGQSKDIYLITLVVIVPRNTKNL